MKNALNKYIKTLFSEALLLNIKIFFEKIFCIQTISSKAALNKTASNKIVHPAMATLLLIIFIAAPTHATLIVTADSTTPPFGFTTKITTKVFDRTTGTFYVGTTAPIGKPAFSIAKAVRPNFEMVPTFSGIATTASSLANTTIEFLTLSPQPDAAAILGVVTSANGAVITALPTDGTAPESTDPLGDATGTAPTVGIVSLAASTTYFFAGVRPSGSGNFGDPGSGIALVNILKSQNGRTETVQLTVLDAQTGEIGNTAQELNNTSAVLTGGTTNVTFAEGEGEADLNKVAMFFDDLLERLYIGVRIATGANINDIGKAVVVGYIDDGVELVEIVSNSALMPAANNIVVTLNSSASSQNLSIQKIRTMHASTGPTYLIVSGGQGASDEVGNQVWALPLVDDPNAAEHGTLANKNSIPSPSPDGRVRFTVPATGPGDLLDVSDNGPHVDLSAAQVGASNLPILPIQQISDMVVVGDTVYVSIAFESGDITPFNDTGIFYSQALFDKNGKIVDWTNWTKRGVPFKAFGDTLMPGGEPNDGPIAFFDVDAATGNIWVVDGTTQQVVGITSWAVQSAPIDLVTTLNAQFICKPCAVDPRACGCTAVLDLDQATPGFNDSNDDTDPTKNRYALFAGNNQVIFALTSQATDTPAAINSPQLVTDDYSNPENFLTTPLPDGAGCCRALEYSRQSPGTNTNYFFVGTDNGLFVFANKTDGTGFDATTLGNLNMPPFANSSWQKISSISGAVIDIKTSGNRLYVLTKELTKNPRTPIINTLFAFNFEADINTMFGSANSVILAQTNAGPEFANIVAFFGIQIIATGDPANNPAMKEQLILATNQGLFKSNADQTGAMEGIADPAVINQTLAAWVAIGINQTTMFSGIAGIDTPVRYTVWPIGVQDKYGAGIFDWSSIYQLSGTGYPAGTEAAIADSFVPAQFNALSTSPQFTTLNPINYFWSDGARRLFIVRRPQDPYTVNRIMSLPFNVAEWNISAPTILSNPTLANIERFYWIKQIGATGLLMAGTNRGVVSLQ